MLDKVLLESEIKKITQQLLHNRQSIEEEELLKTLKKLMHSIPEKRKASYGIVSVIALFCKQLAHALEGDTYEVGNYLYHECSDFRGICVGLGLLSHVGVKSPEKVLPYFVDAADHDVWEVKEFVQMFIRKITKEHKALIQNFLIELTKSNNANHRRFASEALRPVVENKWIQSEAEYSLKVLRLLFKEEDNFPKVSVANNLSDLARKNPELVLEVVKELMDLGNQHSDFIAYRACRNLIKEYPLKVMDLLNVDTYKYKSNTYHRGDY